MNQQTLEELRRILKTCESSLFPVWIPPAIDEEITRQISTEFRIHPQAAQVLVSRGFREREKIHSFLYAKLPNIYPPETLSDMAAATARLYTAIDTQESILIYGDNDVDGMTATALLVEFLQTIGAQVAYYIPDRNKLKQSVIADAVAFAKQHQCTLLITVDCGISVQDETDLFAENHIDVIITDHHEIVSEVPNVVANLNPKHPDHPYPNRDLTGVGVAFKLAHAMTNLMVAKGDDRSNAVDLKSFLDLVALGTIADMGVLLDENRIIVRAGVMQLQKGRRIGLNKLMKVCDVRSHDITTMDIATKISPRLNSLGRISDPQQGVELFLIKDPNAAETLATKLDLNNADRQRMERSEAEAIERMIASHPEILREKAIVLHGHEFHAGIIPLHANRVVRLYNRPTVLIAIDQDGIGKGSIRSIPSSRFKVLDVLKSNRDLLIDFGGHDLAAGFSILETNIATFKRHFIEAAGRLLQDQDISPKLSLDGPLGFKELTFDFLESISMFEPFGTGNPPPVFFCEVRQVWPARVVGKFHLRLYLEEGERFLEGIAFNQAFRKPSLMRENLRLLIAFTPVKSNNRPTIHLQIRDFKIISND